VFRSLDLSLLRLLRTRGHGPAVEAAVGAFSTAGEHGLAWYAVAGAGTLLDPSRRPLYARAALVVLSAFMANQSVKLLVRRRRPRLDGLPPLADTRTALSYPSAHASTSFAAAHALSPALPSSALYAVAAAMALSRPYLGVHYVSDTIAGAALGRAVAELMS
jgi:hypothetical protein